MVRSAEGSRLVKVYGLLAGAFLLFIAVIALLAALGLPERAIAVLIVTVTLAAYAAIGIATRTLSLAGFFVAERSVSAGLGGMAIAGAMLSAAAIGLAGAFFADRSAGFAVAVGLCAGLVLLAVLVAPYYRKSGAVTLPDFLAVRYGNPLVRAVALVILIAVTLPVLAAAIAIAGDVAASALGVATGPAVVIVLAVLLLPTLLGGMGSTTHIAGAQMVVLVIGVLLPSVILSVELFGFPVPQVTFGYAVGELAGLAGTPIGVVAGEALPVSRLDGFNLFAYALCLAAAVASFPHIVARLGAVPGVARARLAAGWAIVVVAVVTATAPAIAAFAQDAVFRDVVGVELADLPQWVFDYGRRGLVTICGAAPVSPAAIGTACGASTVLNGLVPGDIALTAEAVMLGFADMTGLPFVFTALISAAVIAAALGVAGAALLAIALSLGHDAFGSLIGGRSSAGRRLIVARLALVAVAVLAAWLAVARRGEVFAYAFAAPSVAAAGFFPAVVLGIWWRRATFWGALAGMLAAGGATAGYAVATTMGAMPPVAVIGLTDLGIAPAAAGIVGVPLGAAVMVAVSLLTPAPSAGRREVIDAIRRPSPDPILEDHAA
jgi:cation/acetate symporter